MTNTAILAASALLLFAYLVDIFGRRLRLPAVVLLIVTGIVTRQAMDSAGVHLRWVDPIVPVLGTIGLILIVLEGALDLTVRRERSRLILRSSASAVLGFGVTVTVFTLLFQLAPGLPFPIAALGAIPFAVISSAVAIPTSTGLPEKAREFVIYESSLSDIIGVLVFYSWLGANGSLAEFAWDLFGGGGVSLVAAAFAALGLYYLVNRVVGHVRFLPLLAGLICLYAVGKELHLSPLILVLICGLLLNNPHLIGWHPRLRSLQSADYEQTLHEFKGIVGELTFAFKSFFFLLLGYWTDLTQMTTPLAWQLAAAVLVTIYATRWVLLRVVRQGDAGPLLWIAPRGLITVLLFLTATETGKLAAFPFGAVMLVVLVSGAATALAHRQQASSRPPDQAELAPKALQ